jgi:hypothetical protein
METRQRAVKDARMMRTILTKFWMDAAANRRSGKIAKI